MARRTARAFGHAIQPTDTVNQDRFPAYTRPIEEQFLQTLLTNTLGNTFYLDTKKLVSETERVHSAMVRKDPAFMAQALIYARNKGFMRTQPVYGLARLTEAEKPHFETAFPNVVRTPNDLADFFAVVKGMKAAKLAKGGVAQTTEKVPNVPRPEGGEGGRRVKRAAGAWLLSKLSEYWAVKYGAEKIGGYSLSDMITATHPKGAKLAVVDYIRREKRKDYQFNPELLPQVAAFERLKKATTAKEKIEAITAGRLPHEVASTFAGNDPEVWKAIVGAMPTFAMLRNLATMERIGIMESVREHVVRTFTNSDAIQKSMIFPYRFLEASKHVHDRKVVDALRAAVDLSFMNMPEIPGRTLVFLDVSGSMQGFLQTAALFALSAIKKAKDGDLWLFDTSVHPFRFSMADSVLSQAEKIHCMGGTDVGAPMQKALRDGYKADTVVLITDEQQNTGTAFYKLLDEYRRKVNAGTKCFILNVAPYVNASLVPVADEQTYFTFGMSDAALRFIGMVAKGWGTLVEVVRSGKWDEDPEEVVALAASGGE